MRRAGNVHILRHLDSFFVLPATRAATGMHSARRFQFLQFTYDVTTGELRNAKETVRLQPQPAAALRVLLQNAGQLVTRETLKQAIWPDTVVEADQGLNFCVRQIRVALGEDAESGSVIETLPRRGYRFVAPVNVVDALANTSVAKNTTTNSATPSPANESGNWATNRSLSIAALAVLAIMLTVVAYSSDDRSRPSLAILPLNSTENDAWARGQNAALTEALVAALTNAPSDTFGVVGPSSTARFAASTRPHTEIGKELGVDYVVSGGVRLTDSTMFIQVIRVTDGVHIFAWRQRPGGRDAATLATLVAKGIATKVK